MWNWPVRPKVKLGAQNRCDDDTHAHTHRLTIATKLTTLLTCLSSTSKHVSMSLPSPLTLSTAQRNTASSKTDSKPCHCSPSLCQSGPVVISFANRSPFRRCSRMSDICAGIFSTATHVADMVLTCGATPVTLVVGRKSHLSQANAATLNSRDMRLLSNLHLT